MKSIYSKIVSIILCITLFVTCMFGTTNLVSVSASTSDDYDNLIVNPTGVTPNEKTVEAIKSGNVDHFYYNQLSEKQQKIYDDLFLLLKDETRLAEYKISLSEYSSLEEAKDDFDIALGTLTYDNPMYLHRLGEYEYSEINNYLVLNGRTSLVSAYDYEKAQEVLTRWVQAINTGENDYQKIKIMWDILANNVKYNIDPAKSTWHNVLCTSVIGPTVYGESVCAGYCALVKELCDRVGIPCVQIGNYSHAWDYVMIDGFWYAIDATGATYGVEPDNILMSYEYNIYSGATDPLYVVGVEGRLDPFVYPKITDKTYEKPNYTVSYTISPSTFVEKTGEFIYIKVGNEYVIDYYYGKANGPLELPTTYNGLPVTGITANSFCGQKGFTGPLNIPETYKEIGYCAFEDCTGLTGILNIPSNIEHLADDIFKNCTGFTNLELGQNLLSIGAGTFNGCTGITGELKLPPEINYIGNHAFTNCAGLTGSVTIPKDCRFYDYVFDGCPGLTGTLTLPDNQEITSMHTVGSGFSKYAIYSTNTLYTVENGMLLSKDKSQLIACPIGISGTVIIPETVKEIGDYAFFKCENKGKLTIPTSVRTIGRQAFEGSSFIGDLILPDTIVSIGDRCFYDSNFNGGKLYISQFLQSIPELAFAKTNLTGVLRIPDTIEDVSQLAFIDNSIDFNNIDLSKHTWEKKEILEQGTDLTPALVRYTCTDCEQPITVDIYESKHYGHNITSTEYVKATCTKDGSTNSMYCNDCNVSILEQTIIPKLGHHEAWTNVDTPATCSYDGHYTYGCDRCENTLEKIIPKLDHEWKYKETKAATYVAAGKKIYTCENCGAIKNIAIPMKVIKATTITSVINVSNGITVKWKSTAGVTGYYVYRKDGNGTYKYIGKVTKENLSFTDKNTKKGVTYTYQVRAYNSAQKVNSTNTVACKRKTSNSITKLENVKGKKVTVKWTQNKAATGYQIRYSIYSNFKNATIITIKNNKQTGTTLSNLKMGKIYYVGIRPYKEIKGKITYGVWSNPVKRIKVVK